MTQLYEIRRGAELVWRGYAFSERHARKVLRYLQPLSREWALTVRMVES